MPVGLPVLGTYMPFEGVDAHTALVPMPIPTPTVVPHFVGGVLGLAIGPGRQIAKKVETPCGALVMRGHDVGLPTLHIPAVFSPLYAAVVLGASSKSQFGVSSVRADSAAKPAAVGLLFAAGVQQDCGDIAPMMAAGMGVSLVVSVFNASVQAGFTMGDFVGSVMACYYDSNIACLQSMVIGGIPAVDGGLGDLLITTILGWTLGSPFGVSIPGFNALDAANAHTNNAFSGDGAFDLGHSIVAELL